MLNSLHNTGANYPQQQFNPNGAHSGGASFVPNNQPTPVINNFYGQPQSGGSSGGGGGGFLQIALAAGAGSLAGNALYGALKPDHEQKTTVIHEYSNPAAAAPAAAPAASPAAVAPVNPTAPIVPPMVPVVPAQGKKIKL